MDGKPNTKKIIKIILCVITMLVVSLILLCIGSVIFTKYVLHQPASVLGYRLVKIVTDSMEPTIKTGDYILVKRVVGTEVKKGDIVVHVPAYGDYAGYTMTHRCVKEAYYDETKQRTCILTKGDKTGAPTDEPVPVENVQSVFLRTVKISGFLDFVTSLWGVLILVAIPSLIGISIQIVNVVRSFRKPSEEEVAEPELSEEEKKKQLAEAAAKELAEQQKVLEFIRARKGENAPQGPMSEQEKIMAFLKARRAQQEDKQADEQSPKNEE